MSTQRAPQLPKGGKEVQLAYLTHVRKVKFYDGLWGTVRTAMRCGAWFGCAYVFFAASVNFAGKQTTIKGILEGAFSLSADRYVAYAAAAIFGVSWRRERRLRRRVIKEHAEYIKELERKIDPGRTGSGLDSTGKPRTKD